MRTKTDVTKQWIENYIFELNLCPFSHVSYENNTLEYIEVDSLDEQFIKTVFSSFLKREAGMQHSMLLMFGNELTWDEILDVEGLLELFLTSEQAELIKFVIFHPDYEHGETENELLHYTNKSPLPVIQLLHLDAINQSVPSSVVEKILLDNEKNLSSRSVTELNRLLDGCK